MQWVFEDCRLDLARRELWRDERIVATAPKVFDLLVYLLQNRERVVSRDELIEAVWAGRIVSESTLASHINAVRNAVGDSGRQQRVIRTVARKGIRFVATLRSEPADNLQPPARSDSPADATADSPALPAKPSIAVLPFVNLSGDPAQDYLVEGVVEDIIAALSHYRWLFVVARNSSFAYKTRVVDVKQIGRELGVRYVLEGSWRKAANRVRLTGQLVDASSGAHHWAGRFESVLDDIFDLQDQITESVVGAIALSARTCGNRARQTHTNRQPRRLRLLPARHGAAASRLSPKHRRGPNELPQRHRRRCGILLGLRHGRLVPLLAPGEWLDGGSPERNSGRHPAGAAGGRVWPGRCGCPDPQRTCAGPSGW